MPVPRVSWDPSGARQRTRGRLSRCGFAGCRGFAGSKGLTLRERITVKCRMVERSKNATGTLICAIDGYAEPTEQTTSCRILPVSQSSDRLERSPNATATAGKQTERRDGQAG